MPSAPAWRWRDCPQALIPSVRHGVGEYVRGQVHINGMESFWARLKRGYHGTYHRSPPSISTATSGRSPTGTTSAALTPSTRWPSSPADWWTGDFATATSYGIRERLREWSELPEGGSRFPELQQRSCWWPRSAPWGIFIRFVGTANAPDSVVQSVVHDARHVRLDIRRAGPLAIGTLSLLAS